MLGRDCHVFFLFFFIFVQFHKKLVLILAGSGCSLNSICWQIFADMVVAKFVFCEVVVVMCPTVNSDKPAVCHGSYGHGKLWKVMEF